MDLTSFYKGKNVFITGGSGFIGAALTRQLIKYNARVTIYDINTIPLPKLFPESDDITFITGNILDYEKLVDDMKGANYVFHLAALLGVDKSDKIPYNVLEVNLRGTHLALKSAKANGVKRFLLTSSSEVYGNSHLVPFEEDQPSSPISTYGVSKVASEHYCRAAYHELGLHTTIVRFFNAYGIGQDPNSGFVIPSFVRCALSGLQPTVHGDGTQGRCMTYVDEAADGTLRAMAYDYPNETFNIGSNKFISMYDLAVTTCNVINNSLVPEFVGYSENGIRSSDRDVFMRYPDVRKAIRLLKFRANVDIPDGIKMYTDWVESVNNLIPCS